jgi:glycosyltransferase involved in cell wall biosynthesis
MRLAISCDNPNTYSETFIRAQFEHLRPALSIYGGPVASETTPGGPIHPLKNLRGLLDTAIQCGLRGTKMEGPQSAELARRLRSYRINAVLANFGTSGAALAPVCAKLKLPLVVHFHGYDAHQHDLMERLREPYLRMAQSAAAVVVVSEAMRNSLLAAGFPEAKLKLLRYGADPQHFEQRIEPPPVPRFFGVGRFVDKKAPYLTVLAFKEVLAIHPEARLVLAGNGPLEEVVRNLVAALGISHAVEFAGVLTPDQVGAQMRLATSFVQHSLSPRCGPSIGDCEGTPVAVLESMMCGLPVVATRHTGIGEVIQDGITGLLCEERDVAGMALQMLRLIETPGLGRMIGNAAREQALANFSTSHYIGALRSILKSVV